MRGAKLGACSLGRARDRGCLAGLSLCFPVYISKLRCFFGTLKRRSLRGSFSAGLLLVCDLLRHPRGLLFFLDYRVALGRVLGFLLLEFLAALLFGCVRMRLLWDLLQLLDRVFGLWRHILVVEVLLHRGATAWLVLRVGREDLGIPEDSG